MNTERQLQLSLERKTKKGKFYSSFYFFYRESPDISAIKGKQQNSGISQLSVGSNWANQAPGNGSTIPFSQLIDNLDQLSRSNIHPAAYVPPI
jgi:hypothetical protein